MDLIYFVPGDPPEDELVQAAASGNLKQVILLQAGGVPPDARDSRWGRTALQTSAENGHVDVVGYLLKQNVRLDGIDRDGLTPLMGACSRGRNKIALMLIEAGADVRYQRDGDGMTALKFALWGRCSRKVLRVLKARGAILPEPGFPIIWLSDGAGAGDAPWRKWVLGAFLVVGAISLAVVVLEVMGNRA